MYFGRLLFCFKYQTEFELQHGGVCLVTMDTEFSHVTAPYLYTAFVSVGRTRG